MNQQAVAGVKCENNEFRAARDGHDGAAGECVAKGVRRVRGHGARPAHDGEPDHGTRQTVRAQIAHDSFDFRQFRHMAVPLLEQLFYHERLRKSTAARLARRRGAALYSVDEKDS